MNKRIVKTSREYAEFRDGKHRFEHWSVDCRVYFITAQCREKFPAFASDEAKRVFWGRFAHWTSEYRFDPWVTTLLDNHYHTLGFLWEGKNLQPMMQRLHGSVAKLVNDLLPDRRKEFWRDGKGREYFDGCIRDELQLRRAYDYTLKQAVRARLVKHWKDYSYTEVTLGLEACVKFARDHNGFLSDIPYAQYQKYLQKKRNRSR